MRKLLLCLNELGQTEIYFENVQNELAKQSCMANLFWIFRNILQKCGLFSQFVLDFREKKVHFGWNFGILSQEACYFQHATCIHRVLFDNSM